MYRLDVLVIEIWPITTKNPEVEPHPDSSDDLLGRLGWQNIVFYNGQVSETLCFIRVNFRDHQFYYVFLTLRSTDCDRGHRKWVVTPAIHL